MTVQGNAVHRAHAVGDKVLILGKGQYAGEIGTVEKLCPVKVGVRVPNVGRLSYHRPNFLKSIEESRDQESKTISKAVGTELVLAYLEGYKLMQSLVKGLRKDQAHLVLEELCVAWSEGKAHILSGESDE